MRLEMAVESGSTDMHGMKLKCAVVYLISPVCGVFCRSLADTAMPDDRFVYTHIV